ncbi:MAG: phosphatase PAP2 family protein [archaeon]
MKNISSWIFIGLVLLLTVFLDPVIAEVVAALQLSCLTIFFNMITTLLFVLVLAGILSVAMINRRDYVRVYELWASMLAAVVVSYLVKFIVMRPRPSADLFTPLVGLLDYSFPSTHAAVYFAVLPILGNKYPRIGRVWLVVAVFMSASRLYLGLHYLSDILFGALLGLMLGNGVLWLERRYKLGRILK